MKTDYAGIDYSMGQSNYDKSNGIHYGVISQNEVLQSWADSSEAEYGLPHCPHCGNEADTLDSFGETFADGIPNDWDSTQHECDEFACANCQKVFGSESAFGDEPIGFYINDEEYTAHCSDDGDIFITRSPYYTHSQFCSPCAPGAGYLMNHCPSGPKTYCFGHDWFDSGIAPYPIYKVSDNSQVLPE